MSIKKVNADRYVPAGERKVPGPVLCLRCAQVFESEDKTRVRICNKCKRSDERYGLLAESGSAVLGTSIPDADED